MCYHSHATGYKLQFDNVQSDLERRKMYKGYDNINGLPPRVYRDPQEIKEDIELISERIEETNSMLNIRSLIIDILVADNKENPEQLIWDLEDAIKEAKSALELLASLNEELLMLEDEITEARCRI